MNRHLCQCTHSKLAHNHNTGCVVLGCLCKAFQPKQPPALPSPVAPSVPLDASADSLFSRINGKAGFRARYTKQGVEVEAYVGGEIINCKRSPMKRVMATGSTLAAALTALLMEAGK